MQNKKGKVFAVVSGKGGVGKTTASANIATGLANKGFRVIVIDFDIGQSNLDLILGLENRVVHNIIDVINEDVNIEQAIITGKGTTNLCFIAAAQDKDKSSLKSNRIKKILMYLRKRFDYIIIDAPAGIESGFEHAIEFADEAIIVVNPEVSSIRDADKAIGLIDPKSHRVKTGNPRIKKQLLINRVDADMISRGSMLHSNEIKDILQVDLLGLIPEEKTVLVASNSGQALVLDNTPGGKAFDRVTDRILGKKVKIKNIEKKGWF